MTCSQETGLRTPNTRVCPVCNTVHDLPLCPSQSHTERFRIRWDTSVSQYKVSIPNYDGGEVVTAEAYDRLRNALRDLVYATEDTLRSHLRATECCAVTRERCKKARELLTDDRMSGGGK